MRKHVFIFATLLLLAVLALILFGINQKVSETVSLVNSNYLALLPKKDASTIDMSHLGEAAIPPTNKWYSGLVLQKTPKTVFPLPLSFSAKVSGFAIGMPVVNATHNTIFGSHDPDITANIVDAKYYKVSRYDELSVDLTYSNGSGDIATVTVTAGSPYVYLYAETDTEIALGKKADHESTRVAAFDGAVVSSTNDRSSITMPTGSLATFYILPQDHQDTLAETAGNRITGTQVSYAKTDNGYQTDIKILTSNQKATVFGLMPHHAADIATVIEYDTIYGKQKFLRGSKVAFTVPEAPLKRSLDISNLNTAERQLLETTLRRDINAHRFTAEDTYFGGKELYRAAQLLDLSHQLDQKQSASNIQQKLRREFDEWLSTAVRTKKYFYYDTRVKGIGGETKAFGSEDFNDHHFHYGYFIYAASILSKYDSGFLAEYGSMINLLVADIANYNKDEKLPLRRHFDPYFGHSWAAGSSPFDDGNNQESSSEAINAWVATSLWAQRTDNTELALQSGWMLANEVASTKAYWMDFNQQEAPYNDGYGHGVVALNWGGKRDYSTFFSAEPNAMLGIQLIPMNPTMNFQEAYGSRIEAHIAEALTDNNYDVQFGDYIIMYRSLAEPGMLNTAKSLPDEYIDGANSRSYMYAWIMSNQPND